MVPEESLDLTDLKKLHLYYKMITLGLAPEFKCSSFVDDGAMRINVDEEYHVTLVCDSCGAVNHIGVKDMDTVNRYINAYEDSLYDISISMSDLD